MSQDTLCACCGESEAGIQGFIPFVGEIRDRIEKVAITAWRLVCEPLFWNACWARMTADAREVPLADVSFPLTDAERMEQREHYRRLLALCNKYEINQYREGILIDHASEQIRNYLGLGEGEEI